MPFLSEKQFSAPENHRWTAIRRALSAWVLFASRFAGGIVFLSFLITVVLFDYTVNHLGMNTDTADMFSENLAFRRHFGAFKAAFPQFNDTLLIVIEADTPEQAQEASKALAKRLRGEPDLFKMVYLPGSNAFFQKNGLLFLDRNELEDLADNLARVQPFLGRLTRDLDLRGLFSMLTAATRADSGGGELDLSLIFNHIRKAADAALSGRRYTISWQELITQGDVSPEDRQRFITTRPRLDYSRILPAEDAVKEVRHLIGEMGLTEAGGVRVRLTGDVALEYEELESVTRSAGIAGLMSLVLVGFLLMIGLRSFRLVSATLLTLVAGLIWTAWFASVVVGHLNIISVAFAVLYIGLSVDYGIHFCLRYQELIRQGDSLSGALRRTAGDVGSSLLLCCLTTAIGFYAFIPTSFSGIAELGIISGTGMFFSLVANLTLLPALLTLMPLPSETRPRKPARSEGDWNILSFPEKHGRMIKIGALVMGIGALYLIPHVRFDANPMNMRDPGSESVKTFRKLLAVSRHSPWTLNVLTPDAEAAKNLVHRLGALGPVRRALWLRSFIPDDQDAKLDMIEEIDLLVGPELSAAPHRKVPGVPAQVTALEKFLTALASYAESGPNPAMRESARRLNTSLKRFLSELQTMAAPERKQMLQRLDASILGTLPARLRALDASLGAGRITAKDLPPDLVARWRTADGRYRVEVMPRGDLNDEGVLRGFVNAVRTVAPTAVGLPVVYMDACDAVVDAFQQAFGLAMIAITLLLLVLLRQKTDVFLVLLPLMLAGIYTGAASVLLDIPFNFANVIALPLIFGIGVDNGIHIVHRMRSAPPANGRILQTSTARSVLFSSLTTVCSFGNLAISSHRGLASLGIMFSIGIGFVLICTLIILPTFMGKRGLKWI